MYLDKEALDEQNIHKENTLREISEMLTNVEGDREKEDQIKRILSKQKTAEEEETERKLMLEDAEKEIEDFSLDFYKQEDADSILL